MVTLSTFLQFWGVVFLATTGFVCFFKPEVENGVNEKIMGLVDTYKQVRACGVKSRLESCDRGMTFPEKGTPQHVLCLSPSAAIGSCMLNNGVISMVQRNV